MPARSQFTDREAEEATVVVVEEMAGAQSLRRGAEQALTPGRAIRKHEGVVHHLLPLPLRVGASGTLPDHSGESCRPSLQARNLQ
jgi:hypothetical protein